MLKKYKIFFIVLITSLSLFASPLSIKNMINYTINFLYRKPTKVSSNSNCITIYIHGTVPPIVHQLFDDFFYAKKGLHPANTYKENYRVYKIAKALSNSDNMNFNLNNIYIFGWSGKLNYIERKKAAINLHQEIINLIEKNKLTAPKIKIISHSHGGNVALNLATIKNATPFIIEELILLGCPIQEETSHLAEEVLFKNVYSFYSNLDFIQILDPQGINKIKKQWSKNKKLNLKEITLFSKRTFNSKQKAIQSHVKINGRSILHGEFMRIKFIKNLPNIINLIKKWKIEQKLFNLPFINYFEFNIEE